MTRRTRPVQPDDKHSSNGEDAREMVAVWLKKRGGSGSPEAVRETIENVTGFFKLLQEWEEADRIIDGNVKDGADDGQS